MEIFYTTLIVIIGTVSLLGLLSLFGIRTGLFPSRTEQSINELIARTSLTQSDDEELSEEMRERFLKGVQEAKAASPIKDCTLTLEKRLKYARWKISPLIFHLFELTLGMLVFALLEGRVSVVVQYISLLSGPLLMRWMLGSALDRRFKHFDADYPQYLMSVVGLLKTGMTAMVALEAGAKGLDVSSLVRQEVELMLERLRYGVSEDKSIGSFGEDIFHPEIELFIQALLLSRRVGGNLSGTLERLAKQVRRRQYFRNSAIAAVSLQRGSVWVILGILVFIECFVFFSNKEMVYAGLRDPFGWQVWQVGFVVIALGIYWVRQVTKMKI